MYQGGKYLLWVYHQNVQNRKKKKTSDLENRSTEIIKTGTHTNTLWLKKREREREKNPSINCRTVSEGLSYVKLKSSKKRERREII